MRRYSMRDVIRDFEAGQSRMTPEREQEIEREVERDAALAEELNKKLTPALLAWLAEHPTATADVVAPVLLQMAALQVMAGLGMEPDDFAELARAMAEMTSGKAAHVRKQAEAVMKEKTPAASAAKPTNPPVDRRHSGATESKRFETTEGVQNLAGQREAQATFHIYPWHPRPNAEGSATQVHLVAEFPAYPEIMFTMRLKSRAAMDEFIDKLIEHKLEVWPSDA